MQDMIGAGDTVLSLKDLRRTFFQGARKIESQAMRSAGESRARVSDIRSMTGIR